MRRSLVALSCTLLLGGGGAAAAAPASSPRPASASSWHVDPISLTANDTTELTGIDCSNSAEDGTCLAVGSVTNSDESHHPVIERRTGSGWVNVPAAEPSGASDSELASISCVSATSCLAVGRAAFGRTVRTLIEQSDAGGWSLQNGSQLPGTATAELSGISCVSASFCVAVGDAGTRTTRHALIETWDGTAWSLVDAPNSTLPSTQLRGVDCTSPVFCAAVGSAGPSATVATATVEEIWTGSTWTVTTAQTGDSAELTALDCTSTTFCMAVGDLDTSGGGSLTAERWNGSSWAAMKVGSPSGDDARLTGISCTSASYCAAVGTNDVKSELEPFARVWNGAAFVAAPQPFPFLLELAVKCFSPNQCEGVGGGNEDFDGSYWTLEQSPAHNGAPRPTRLTAVSCIDQPVCVAVGDQYYGGSDHLPLTLQSSDASWTGVRDQPVASSELINAVSCGNPRARFCYSSGYYQPQAKPKTLVERLEGDEWFVEQGVPNVGPSNAISCTSTFCVVTGAGAVAMFDGTAWTSMPITGPGGANVELNGIHCLSATDCVMVGGYYRDSPDVESALVERWDGTRWSVLAAPRGRSGRLNTLRAVTCLSASACVAVGTSHAGSDHSLIFQMHGASWTTVAHPATGAGLDAVACAAAGSCVAVGPNGSALASVQGTWSTTYIAGPPGDTGALPQLTGITYVGGTYRAVGFYDRLGDRTALTESLSG